MVNQLGDHFPFRIDSFLHWSCVGRRRHCRLMNPHPVPLPGRGTRAALLDASCTKNHASVAGFKLETGLRHQR